MSTPVIPAVPDPQQPDPQTMPLADLKAALTNPPAAEPAPTPAPAPAPAPAATPEPYHIEKLADGTVHVKLDSGEEFRGTYDEVLPKIAKSKYDSSSYAKQLKHELETKSVPAQPPVQPPAPPAEDPDTVAARNWMVETLAKDPATAKKLVGAAFGIQAEQLDSVFSQMTKATNEMQLNSTWIEFHQSCQDFVDTKENCDILVSYLPADLNRLPTSEELRRAHAAAVYDKKYATAPAPAPAAGPSPPVPPPMPSSGGVSSAGEPDPWTMPLADLKRNLQR